MNKSEIANYADDNTHYAIDDDIEKVICKLKSDYMYLKEWLSSNYMKDNQDKLQLLLPNHDDVGITIARLKLVLLFLPVKMSGNGKIWSVKFNFSSVMGYPLKTSYR